MVHFGSIEVDLCLDFDEFLLVHADKLEVLTRDVVVVVFHFSERLLMVFQKLIDMLVLSFLDLVNLDLLSQIEFVIELNPLALILLDKLDSLLIE